MSSSFCDCVNQWEKVVGLQVLKDTKYLSLRTRGGESASRCFQPGEGPSRGLHRDCETSNFSKVRFQLLLPGACCRVTRDLQDIASSFAVHSRDPADKAAVISDWISHRTSTVCIRSSLFNWDHFCVKQKIRLPMPNSFLVLSRHFKFIV